MNDPRKITEKVFLAQVRKAALIHGYRFYHTFNSMRSDVGFPDICMVNAKKGRLIFAELKSDKGKVTPKQQEWLDDLLSLGGYVPEVYLWRPSDMDEIWEILRR